MTASSSFNLLKTSFTGTQTPGCLSHLVNSKGWRPVTGHLATGLLISLESFIFFPQSKKEKVRLFCKMGDNRVGTLNQQIKKLWHYMNINVHLYQGEFYNLLQKTLCYQFLNSCTPLCLLHENFIATTINRLDLWTPVVMFYFLLKY